MNIIVVSRRLSGPRTFNLRERRVLLPACLGLAAVLLAVMGLGAAAGTWLGRMPQTQELERLQAAQARQEAELAALRERADAHMNGLALRLGELQGHAMRLNALGRRLVKIAGLDEGEFDFDQIPALGGPESGLTLPAMEIPGFEDAVSQVDRRLSEQRQQLSVLERLLLNRELKDRQQPAGRPVKSGWLSSAYGNRIDPFTGKRAWHGGVDFAGQAGSEVLAVAEGVVTWSGQRYGYGNLVEVDHGNGFATRYGHNDANLVQVGERVRKGQVLARMGSTGRATAPNVHFEVLKEGRPVNPYGFVRDIGG